MWFECDDLNCPEFFFTTLIIQGAVVELLFIDVLLELGIDLLADVGFRALLRHIWPFVDLINQHVLNVIMCLLSTWV